MKRNQIFVGLALGAAAVLVGCNTNSPTAPKTPTPSTYGISLTVSPSVAGINETITAVALVTVGGSNAPDGTKVTFTTSGSAYIQLASGALTQQAISATSGGSAAVSVISPVGGTGLVTASVPNRSVSQTVHFTGGNAAQAAIFSIMPNQAPAMTAGTTVVLHGQGLFQPQSVTFVVNNNNYPAPIVSVAADGSSITVTTPQVPAPTSGNTEPATIQVPLGVNNASNQQVVVTVVGLFQFTTNNNNPVLYGVSPATGSASGGEIVTLTGANFVNLTGVNFVFTDPAGGGTPKTLQARIVATQLGSGGANDTAQVVVPRASTNTISQTIYVELDLIGVSGSTSAYPRAFAYVPDVTTPPTIFYIFPTQGSAKGHETVMIYGANFVQPATVQIGAINEIVQSVSSDGTTIAITTQPVSGTVPSAAQDVTVTTSLGVATLPAAFTYKEGVNPQIYTLSPNIGPLEGGTQVTITGIGFQYPVQVLFGTQQAQVLSNNFNQIVCVSPSITASQPGTPTTVSVTVTNIGSGQPVSNGMPFQYGQAMFISSISPGVGPDTGGTQVTVFGQGFSAPVAVTFSGVAAYVQSVAGTQIVATTGGVLNRLCSYSAGDVVVTNIDSATSASAHGIWTYVGAQPLITSITTSCGSGNTIPGNAAPCTLTVNGSSFESNMQLSFNTNNVTITLPETGGTSTQASFTLSSSFEALGINYHTTPCTTGTPPVSGTQNLTTPMDVTITDPSNKCFNTLSGGLLVQPSAGKSGCTIPPVTPTLAIAPLTQTSAAASVVPVTWTISISPAQVATISWVESGSLLFTGPTSGTVTTNGAGLVTLSLTPQAGSVSGQSATITISMTGATPQAATVTVP
ncbi:MAG: IPT/TIG domain-containing protein [Thermoanaerobaculaceae bacterium]